MIMAELEPFKAQLIKARNAKKVNIVTLKRFYCTKVLVL
jgi:hypothetical protein